MAQTEMIAVMIEPEVKAEIDKAREKVPRSSFVRDIIMEWYNGRMMVRKNYRGK